MSRHSTVSLIDWLRLKDEFTMVERRTIAEMPVELQVGENNIYIYNYFFFIYLIL